MNVVWVFGSGSRCSTGAAVTRRDESGVNSLVVSGNSCVLEIVSGFRSTLGRASLLWLRIKISKVLDPICLEEGQPWSRGERVDQHDSIQYNIDTTAQNQRTQGKACPRTAGLTIGKASLPVKLSDPSSSSPPDDITSSNAAQFDDII